MVLKCMKASSGDQFPIHKNIYLAIKGVKHSGSYAGYNNENVYSFTLFCQSVGYIAHLLFI